MPARTPEERDHLFGEYINSGDLDRLLKLYDPACGLVQRDGSVATGHAAIREVLGRLGAMQPKFSSKVVKVLKAGDNLAMVYSDWTMSARRPPEGQIEVAGKAIEVVRRQSDGTWLVILDDPFGRTRGACESSGRLRIAFAAEQAVRAVRYERAATSRGRQRRPLNAGSSGGRACTPRGGPVSTIFSVEAGHERAGGVIRGPHAAASGTP